MDTTNIDRTKTWQENIFEWFVVNKKLVHIVTNALYLVLVGIVFASTYSIYSDMELYNTVSIYRAWFGRIGLLVLFIILTPGIVGRLGLDIKISRILTLYRRRLGILFFSLVFTHFHLVTLPKIAGIETLIIPPPIFQLFGATALMLGSLLFFTSNNFSLKKLGVKWKWLHRSVYIILLMILFHTALQRASIWSLLAGLYFALELFSFIFSYLRGGSIFNKPIRNT